MAKDFDVVVVGGGSAGLTAAGVAAHLGAKTLLIEQDRLGGDCTWTGCIPSKTLLHAAHTAHAMRRGKTMGVSAGDVAVDFASVMEHVRATRRQIYEEADDPAHFEAMGIAVEKGRVSLEDAHTLQITTADSRRRITSRYVILATGASPTLPPLEGIEDVPFLTTERIFELKERPEHLLVLGGGPVGVELGQAFRRLGSDVTLVEMTDRILTNDDEEAAVVLQRILEADGIRLVLGARITSVQKSGVRIILTRENGTEISGDALLVATGRSPNVDGLELDAAGIDYSRKGIRVDDRCRTSASNVYAVGDVTGRYAFTHMAEHMAKTAVMNALLKIPTKIDTRRVPWVTYTDPEVAHVGATLAELREEGRRFETHRFPYDRLDRAATEGTRDGFITLYARKWSGKILGASIVGARAGDMISEVALAMRNGVSVRRIADTIHPYPSYGLGVRRAADQWYLRRHAATAIRALQAIFRYRGDVPQHGPDDTI